MYIFVSEILGKGIDLPRMKHAQLVNSVLKMEEVSVTPILIIYSLIYFGPTTVLIPYRDS